MAVFEVLSKTWSGAKNDRSTDNAITFREQIVKSFKETPDKIFQISDDEDTKLTYRETGILSIRIGLNLKKFGFKQGDIVTLIMRNSTFHAPIVFGCILSGITLAPLLFRQGINSERLEQSLNHLKPKAIFLEELVADLDVITGAINKAGLDCKIFAFSSDKSICKANIYSFHELITETEEEKNFELSIDDGITDESIVLIISSSGTTGPAKSVSISGKALKFCKYSWKYRNNPVVATYTTITWISGTIALFFTLFNNGLRINLTGNFNVKHYGNVVRKYNVTTAVYSVEQCLMMMESSDFNSEDFKSMKEFYGGGERVPCKLREFLKSNLGPGVFSVAYGSSESGIVCHLDPTKDTSGVKDNIVGDIDPNTMFKIVDLKSNKPLGPNEVGEIYMKSETMFTGYYGNEELTSKVLDADGWFKMGDFGYFDYDGALHVHGRVTDMISVNGKMMHVSQFENAFESVDGVKSACVVDLHGEVLAALIMLLPGSNLNEEKLKDFANRMENIKFQGEIFVVDEIPRTNSVSNKILRSDARKLALKLTNLRKLQVLTRNVKSFEMKK